MSGQGQERKRRRVNVTSALPHKADINCRDCDVRFVPIAGCRLYPLPLSASARLFVLMERCSLPQVRDLQELSYFPKPEGRCPLFCGFLFQRSPLFGCGPDRPQRLNLRVEGALQQTLETALILSFANLIVLFHRPTPAIKPSAKRSRSTVQPPTSGLTGKGMLRLSALTRRRQRVHVRSRAMLDLNQAMICRSRLVRSPRSAEVARGFRAASHLFWVWVAPPRTSCWVNSTSRNHWYKYLFLRLRLANT